MRWALLTLSAVVGILITVSLGRWQLSRASQKESIQRAQEAQKSQPLLDSSTLAADAAPMALLHRSVLLRGKWLQEKTVFLDNRQMDGRVGFFAITPLALQGSQTVVLVQRGWAPRGFENRNLLPTLATPVGIVEVNGRIAPAPAKLYELSSSGEGPIRQNIDIGAFGAEIGAPLMAVTVQQTGANSDGLLRQWPSPNTGVDKHYGYAFQWFGLAALIAVLYFWFQIFRRFIYRPKDSSSHV
jgi:surfeit locus 1 family protein